MPEISMCTLVVWVNHSSEECLNKPQLYAAGERIAEITLNVNTTGYSRRKDDGSDVRDAGANVLELGRRIGLCVKSIVGAGNPSFVWLLSSLES
jgi:hypothetical protein